MRPWTWAVVIACGAGCVLASCGDRDNPPPVSVGDKQEAAPAGVFSRDAFNREVAAAREELSKSVAAIPPVDPALRDRVQQMSGEEVVAAYRADVVPVLEKFRAARVAFIAATDAARKPLDEMIEQQSKKAATERRESVNVFISKPLPLGSDGVQGEAVVGGDQGDDHTVARMTRLGYIAVRTENIALVERRGRDHPFQPFECWCVRNGTVDAQTLVGQTKTVPLYVDAPTVEATSTRRSWRSGGSAATRWRMPSARSCRQRESRSRKWSGPCSRGCALSAMPRPTVSWRAPSRPRNFVT